MTSFAKNVESIGTNMKDLISLSDNLEDIKSLNDSFLSLNTKMLEKIVIASEKIEASRQDILLVENSIHDIRAVAEMKKQVSLVSSIGDSIGLIAGCTDDIKRAADYANVFGGVAAMKPMIEETLKLSIKMDLVLDLEEKMDSMLAVEKRLDAKIKVMNGIEHRTSKSEMLAVNMLNKISTKEKTIEEKLKEIKKLHIQFTEFNVDIGFVDHKHDSSSNYNSLTHTLSLKIKEGEPGVKGDQGEEGSPGRRGIPGTAVAKGDDGEKGDKGKDGNNFIINVMGKKRELAIYGNRPVGTSFLSLDEIPCMIYFRKSNVLNDWTKGQPFGVSNGGYIDDDRGIDIVNGININELTSHILKNMKGRTNG